MGIITLSSIGSILVAMAFYTELTVHMIDPMTHTISCGTWRA